MALRLKESRVTLVRNHSSHVEDLWPVLQRLQNILCRSEMAGFKKITPAQMKRRACRPVDRLQLLIQEQTASGFRLVALKGQTEQQIFVLAEGQNAFREMAPRNTLQDAIDEAVGEDVGGEVPTSAVRESSSARRDKPVVQLTEAELKQRLLQRYGTERLDQEADTVLEAVVGPKSKAANRATAAEIEVETRREHKTKFEQQKEAVAHANSEKNIAAATRKLRAIKGCMDSTTHTSSAGHLDKGAIGTGAHANDREAQKALVRAHAEDAAARKRY